MIQVTCALIIDNGKVLITQNGENSDHPLQWEFPGGKRLPEESREACIIREIDEELELKIDVIEALFPIKHDYGIKKIILIPFICSIKNGSIKLNNHVDKKWVDLNQLQTIDFSAADKRLFEFYGNRKILEKYTGEKMNQS